jgi:hypothetical protein
MSNLRQEMPFTAAFLDELRTVFGREAIDGQIRKGLNGEPTFWARENGRKLGARSTVCTSAVKWDARGVSYSAEPDWILAARELARQRGVEIRPADPGVWGDDKREADALRKMIANMKGNGK